MRLTIEFFGQVRDAAGVASETIELNDGARLGDLLDDLARRRGLAADSLRSQLVSVNERLTPGASDPALREGDVVTILSPIAGG